MEILTSIFVLIVVAEHFYILYLEMFALKSSASKHTFRLTDEATENPQIRTLLANQGLYNGFLATGLLLALLASSKLFVLFFLGCVLTAAIYGAITANKGILIKQGLPALIAFGLVVVFGV